MQLLVEYFLWLIGVYLMFSIYSRINQYLQRETSLKFTVGNDKYQSSNTVHHHQYIILCGKSCPEILVLDYPVTGPHPTTNDDDIWVNQQAWHLAQLCAFD